MDASSLRKLLQEIQDGRLSPDEAMLRLRHMPFEDLGFAKIDHHRQIRAGMPEVIFSRGKTPSQVAQIFRRMAAHGGNVLATNAAENHFRAVKKAVRKAEYRELAQAITLHKNTSVYCTATITVISAGTTNIPPAEEAVATSYIMGNQVSHLYDVGLAAIS